MPPTEERLEQCIERETAALDLQSQGEIFMTVGKALLGMDLILVCFVDISVRTGSRLFIWWAIAEGLLGLLLIGTGARQKARAHNALITVERE